MEKADVAAPCDIAVAQIRQDQHLRAESATHVCFCGFAYPNTGGHTKLNQSERGDVAASDQSVIDKCAGSRAADFTEEDQNTLWENLIITFI